MQFIDLAAQQRRIRAGLERRIHQVLDHGQYILGPEIRELEAKLACYAGVKHCLTCASGTDALLMPLMALGVGPGDAVFVPTFTFVATAEVVALCGACPVFVDIEKDTFNISSESLSRAYEVLASGASGLRPRGIIPVDLFGQPADYSAINDFAAKHDLFVLEDAAQGFGAEYQGRKSCSLASIGATSFFPAKPLGCYGDGGAIFLDDDQVLEKLLSIRVHGQGEDKYDNVRLGINGRMDTLQAAVVLEKLEIFDEEIALRNRAAERYSEMLENLVEVPRCREGRRSVWAQYSVLSDKRSLLQDALKKEGIPTAVYYSKPLHKQKAYLKYVRESGFGESLPVSEAVAREVFSLPMHPYLEIKDQEKIASVIRGVIELNR